MKAPRQNNSTTKAQLHIIVVGLPPMSRPYKSSDGHAGIFSHKTHLPYYRLIQEQYVVYSPALCNNDTLQSFCKYHRPKGNKLGTNQGLGQLLGSSSPDKPDKFCVVTLFYTYYVDIQQIYRVIEYLQMTRDRQQAYATYVMGLS